MNPASWLLSLFQQLLSDALFKRPIEVNLTREANGKIHLKTRINPSSNQPPTQNHYYSGYTPYGQPMLPATGHPQYALPQHVQPQHVQPPHVQPQHTSPPAATPPHEPSIGTFPEEYTALSLIHI